jgi:hypothetical protein
MFGRLSVAETDAAREALAASESADHKEFNLDIAKLLSVPFPTPIPTLYSFENILTTQAPLRKHHVRTHKHHDARSN